MKGGSKDPFSTLFTGSITAKIGGPIMPIIDKLESIFAGRSFPLNAGLRAKLSENEAVIFTRYQNLIPSAGEKDQIICTSQVFSLLLDTEQNDRRLHHLGLHSLTRLLGLPFKGANTIQVKSEHSSCEIIDNQGALEALRSRILNTEVLSSFLCKIFIGQFFEERQVLTHFSYGV